MSRSEGHFRVRLEHEQQWGIGEVECRRRVTVVYMCVVLMSICVWCS
jgi:hypothetical protein